MSDPQPQPQPKRGFECEHCHKTINVPIDLPPTTAPCPHCQQLVVSPALEATVDLHNPELNQSPTAQHQEEMAKKAFPKWPLILVGIAVFGCALLGAGILFKKKRAEFIQSTTTERQASFYETKGWRKDAYAVMSGFLAAETAAEKAPFILNYLEKEEEIEQFYSERASDDFVGDIKSFIPEQLAEEDTSRGFFLLSYERPKQGDLRSYFLPLMSLAVSQKLEQPDILYRIESSLSEFTSEAVKITAFFKKEDKNLKLDWSTYVQTKYRLLREFAENPEANKKGIFRVLISQDVDLESRDKYGMTAYRLSDPCNESDAVNVLVNDQSAYGQALAPMKWREGKLEGASIRSATVELAWSSGFTPEITLSKLICWEFLDLGGVVDNWKLDN